MATWNVKASVVDLIEADTADAAAAIMLQRLAGAGFEVYPEDGSGPLVDVFRSED